MKLTRSTFKRIQKVWEQKTEHRDRQQIFRSSEQQILFAQTKGSRRYEYVPCPLCKSDNYTFLHQATKFKIGKSAGGNYHKTKWKHDLISFLVTSIGQEKTSSLLSSLMRRPIKIKKTGITGKGYPVVQCLDCGFFYRNPIYRPKTVVEAYKKGYLKFLSGDYAKGRQEMYDNVLKQIKFVQRTTSFERRRILDIGCGHGLFLDYAKQQGWDPYGMDFADDCVQYAGEHFNLNNVTAGNLGEDSFEEDFFDVVTLWSVAAHLENPIDMFRKIGRVLRSGGLLLVYTVNANGMQHRIHLENWNGFHKNHLVFFTLQTLTDALTKAGFANVEEANDNRDLLRWKETGVISTEQAAYFDSLMQKPNLGNMLQILATNG